MLLTFDKTTLLEYNCWQKKGTDAALAVNFSFSPSTKLNHRDIPISNSYPALQ